MSDIADSYERRLDTYRAEVGFLSREVKALQDAVDAQEAELADLRRLLPPSVRPPEPPDFTVVMTKANNTYRRLDHSAFPHAKEKRWFSPGNGVANDWDHVASQGGVEILWPKEGTA